MKTMNHTLHALIIGIDDYPTKPLHGCVADAEAMHSFLEQYCQKKGWDFKPHKLIDKTASRDNIIAGYQNFSKANAGETCFVFYSGHGWHFPAPKEFWVEANGENQAIVCADSFADARVLTDKEIAYLTWEATYNKGVHFVEVYDCCHSGGITRDLDDTTEARFIPADEKAISGNFGVDTYYGYENYRKEIDPKTQEPRLSVPMSARVTLSAAKSDETSKETVIDGQRRGLFTYSLIETLTEFGDDLTYSELMDYVYFKTKNRVLPLKPAHGDQSPQFDTNDVAPNSIFLTGTEKPLLREFNMGFEDEGQRWLLRAGFVQGIPAEGTTLVKLKDVEQILTVKEVTAGYCVMDVPDTLELDTNRIYKMQIVQIARNPVLMSIANHPLSKNLEETYKTTYETTTDVSFQLSEKTDTLYAVMSNEKGHFIRRNADKRDFTSDNNLQNLQTLFADAEKIGRWHQLLDLKNPASNLKEALKIELFQYAKADNYTNPTATVNEFGLENPVIMASAGENNPNFKLSITNNSGKKLWISAIYMMDNYAIANFLLPLRTEELLPDKPLFISYDGNNLIELSINTGLKAIGVKNIKESIKIIASTDPFNTNSWNQEGVKISDIRDMGSGGGAKNNDPAANWVTFDVVLDIQA
jgi:Caspase domain